MKLIRLNKSLFVERLERGVATVITVYGTSLSYHLAPILRVALRDRYDDSVSVVNSGIAAHASRTALARLDEKVLRHRPDALVMEWAINDAYDYHHEPSAFDAGISLSESRANLETLIDRVQVSLPSTEIILWTTNTTWDVEGSVMRGKSARPDLDRYYQGVRDVASARGLRLIDAEKFWDSIHLRLGEEFCTLIPDGVHPTPKALREYLVPFVLNELGVPEQTL